MASTKKPILCIIHGAWHRPLHYIDLVVLLKAKGYTVVVPALATSGFPEDVAKATLDDNIKIIHSAIKPFSDAGDDVVLICHSFGGISGTNGAGGETIAERKARGLAGGVKAIVYVASIVSAQGGVSAYDLMQGSEKGVVPDWQSRRDGYMVLTEKAGDVLYNDVDETTASIYIQSTVAESEPAHMQACRYGTGDVKVPKTYVAVKNDRAIPFEAQVAMAQGAGADLVVLNCGHSPFAIQEQNVKLVDIIVEVSAGATDLG